MSKIIQFPPRPPRSPVTSNTMAELDRVLREAFIEVLTDPKKRATLTDEHYQCIADYLRDVPTIYRKQT